MIKIQSRKWYAQTSQPIAFQSLVYGRIPHSFVFQNIHNYFVKQMDVKAISKRMHIADLKTPIIRTAI